MIVCVLWWAYIQFWSNASEKEDVSAKREADWSFQKPKVPETKLTDQEECALCGSRKESLRGISEIVVDYGEDRVLSMEKASQILCQSCLEKLSEAMEVKCEEGKEPEPVDLVLIDFETMELYCVQEQYTKRSIRDYTLWMAHTEDTLEINAVYTPVRTEAGKNAGIKENAVPSSATDDSAASLK